MTRTPDDEDGRYFVVDLGVAGANDSHRTPPCELVVAIVFAQAGTHV